MVWWGGGAVPMGWRGSRRESRQAGFIEGMKVGGRAAVQQAHKRTHPMAWMSRRCWAPRPGLLRLRRWLPRPPALHTEQQGWRHAARPRHLPHQHWPCCDAGPLQRGSGQGGRWVCSHQRCRAPRCLRLCCVLPASRLQR